MRNSSLRLPTITGLLIAAGLAAAGMLPILAESNVRLYTVWRGQLRLQLPAGWFDERQSAAPGTPFLLIFRPIEKSRFLVKLSIAWDEQSGSRFNSPARLQEITLAAGSQFLPRSAEKQLQLQEMKGKHASGYYFVLTDRAPRAGDYEIVAQGALALEDLLIVFTYLGYPGGNSNLRDLIDMFRDASLIRAQLQPLR